MNLTIRIIRDLEAALGQKFVSFLEAIVAEAEGEGNPQKSINKARIVLASAALKVRMGQAGAALIDNRCHDVILQRSDFGRLSCVTCHIAASH